MLSGLKAIITKEVKELLRDPKILLGMIIAPTIVFPIMGLAMQSIFTEVEESLTQIDVAVADLDNGEWSRSFISILQTFSNVRVKNISAANRDEAIQKMLNENLTDLIIILEDFSENVTRWKAGEAQFPPKIEVYSVYTGSGLVESTRSSAITNIIEAVKRVWAPDPFLTVQKSIVKGQPIPVSPSIIFNLIMSQYITVPIVTSVIFIFAMQLAATSVASEKEEKTLETLLSLPIDRFTILMGKLFGSILVALIGALGYLIGFIYYMGSIYSFVPSEGVGVNLADLGLAPTPIGYLLMGISLFVSLLSALALAVVISAFTEDVRSAQTVVGYVYPLMIIPMIMLMYSDISALPLPLRILILAIPYSYPILTSRAAVTGDYFLAICGIIYVAAFTVVVLYIAARFFATEKVLTAKIKLRRFRRKR